jgi:hypothetical protein
MPAINDGSIRELTVDDATASLASDTDALVFLV